MNFTKSVFRRLCLLGCLAFVLSPAAALAQVELRWKLSDAKSYTMTTLQNMEMEMSIADMVVKTTVDNEVLMSMDVTAVSPEGVHTLEMAMQRFVTKMDGPGGQATLDTGSDEPPPAQLAPLADMYKALMKLRYEMDLHPNGETTEMKVDAEALEEVLEQIGRSSPLAQNFNKDTFSQMSSGAWMNLPEQAIEPGYQWESVQKTQSPFGGEIEAVSKYEYLGTEEKDGRSLEKISVKIEMDLSELLKGQAPGIDIKIDEHEMGGVAYFDAEAGRLVEQDLTQQALMTLKTGGREMEQQINSKIIIRLEPAKTTE